MSEITTNIVTATFGSGCTSVTTENLYQYDYGQILKFEGLELPDAFEVHFSNSSRAEDTAKTQIGTTTEDGVSTVSVPDEYLTTGKYIYAFIYLHSEENDGETEYLVTIPVRKRPSINPEPVTPEEQSVITQAIAALQDAVEKTAEDVQTTEQNVAFAEQFADLSELHSEDAEAWAVGQRAGIDVEEDDETFHNNAKYYADAAEQVASEAGFIDLYINSAGHLIYEKTSTVDLEFSIENGHLIVEV